MMLRGALATAILVAALASRSARADAPSSPSVLGRWRVVGCATSPRDPANCAQGTITFEGTQWSVDLPCCKAARAYKVVSAEGHTIKITSDGVLTEIRLDAKGEARWNPGGLGGRVGELSFVREPKKS